MFHLYDSLYVFINFIIWRPSVIGGGANCESLILSISLVLRGCGIMKNFDLLFLH